MLKLFWPFFESIDSDMEYIYGRYVETAMMQAVLTDVKQAEENVLNFKGSIRVIECSTGTGHGSI
jgi:hypothetical protein